VAGDNDGNDASLLNKSDTGVAHGIEDSKDGDDASGIADANDDDDENTTGADTDDA
jgi:hypothetical protein